MFAAYAALGTDRRGGRAAAPVIRMTAADAEWLKEMWTRQWRRPPTDEELTGLVADHLKEEVLAREARALELDVGDTVVRRRLAQKMAFVLDDTIRIARTTGSRAARPLRDASGPRPHAGAGVLHAGLLPPRARGWPRPGQPSRPCPMLLRVLAGQGDRLLLGDTFADQDEQALANLFGAAFAQAVLALPAGRWSGPIESGYGLHLVKVTAVSPPQARPFAEVRERLAEEWRRERQETAQAQLFEA